MPTDKEELIQTVSELYNCYEDDDYMKPKIVNYITNQLPNIFLHMKENHEINLARQQELKLEHNVFIESFLNNNQYFFVPSTATFFVYDGLNYKVYSEDEILYHVLSTVSKEQKNLLSWKQKTKRNVMKRIKESYLLNSIPESETIQSVINALTTNIFPSKSAVKYFLCILGDNLLKKNNHLIHYINPNGKDFIRTLNNLSNMFVGLNLSQTFKYKYHDHDYDVFRVLNIQDNIKYESMWNNILKYHMIDILCVACHYSNRYYSSDEYLENHCDDQDWKHMVLLVKNTNAETLIKEFINEYINKNSSNSQITWKNMQYLWKQFLDVQNIPSIIFFNQLKSKLIESLSDYYQEETDTFTGIFSKSLPSIQNFLQFWTNTIIFDENETDLEIEELLLLYKQWCQTNNIHHTTMNNKQILDIIIYYYPTIEIENDKYLSGIRNTLWDKQMDIQVALDDMKQQTRNQYDCIDNDISRRSPSIYSNISIYDAYKYYCNFISKASTSNLSQMISTNRRIVSKSYFEKYIFDHYENYLIDNRQLTPEWYLL